MALHHHAQLTKHATHRHAQPTKLTPITLP